MDNEDTILEKTFDEYIYKTTGKDVTISGKWQDDNSPVPENYGAGLAWRDLFDIFMVITKDLIDKRISEEDYEYFGNIMFVISLKKDPQGKVSPDNEFTNIILSAAELHEYDYMLDSKNEKTKQFGLDAYKERLGEVKEYYNKYKNRMPILPNDIID